MLDRVWLPRKGKYVHDCEYGHFNAEHCARDTDVDVGICEVLSRLERSMSGGEEADDDLPLMLAIIAECARH